MLLRPCPAIAQHMGALLMRDRLLQFQYAHAEQVWLLCMGGKSTAQHDGGGASDRTAYATENQATMSMYPPPCLTSLLAYAQASAHFTTMMLQRHHPQDFLDWYFKFDRWLLPIDYNSLQPMTHGNQTLSGATAKIVHFTEEKPFVRSALVPQHRYLCRCVTDCTCCWGLLCLMGGATAPLGSLPHVTLHPLQHTLHCTPAHALDITVGRCQKTWCRRSSSKYSSEACPTPQPAAAIGDGKATGSAHVSLQDGFDAAVADVVHCL